MTSEAYTKSYSTRVEHLQPVKIDGDEVKPARTKALRLRFDNNKPIARRYIRTLLLRDSKNTANLKIKNGQFFVLLQRRRLVRDLSPRRIKNSLHGVGPCTRTATANRIIRLHTRPGVLCAYDAIRTRATVQSPMVTFFFLSYFCLLQITRVRT